MRFTLTHGSESRPVLIAETCENADEHAIASFRKFLFDVSCPNGLLFDRHFCHIFRDQFSSMDEGSIVVEQKLPADAVLNAPGTEQPGSLDQRVERWLRVLTTRWGDALPREPELAAPLIADIVPAASGSVVHPVHMETGR